MRAGIVGFLGGLLLLAGPRSSEIPFRSLLIDNGASETAAVADVNKDGKLDIISGESWYESPPRPGSGQATWTKHKFRDLNYTNNYYDNFSDLPVDVDGDGYPDLVRVTWFAKKISWWRNPGRSQAPWQESDIHTGFNIEFAVLADMDNDGKANEVVAQENGARVAYCLRDSLRTLGGDLDMLGSPPVYYLDGIPHRPGQDDQTVSLQGRPSDGTAGGAIKRPFQRGP